MVVDENANMVSTSHICMLHTSRLLHATRNDTHKKHVNTASPWFWFWYMYELKLILEGASVQGYRRHFPFDRFPRRGNVSQILSALGVQPGASEKFALPLRPFPKISKLNFLGSADFAGNCFCRWCPYFGIPLPVRSNSNYARACACARVSIIMVQACSKLCLTRVFPACKHGKNF